MTWLIFVLSWTTFEQTIKLNSKMYSVILPDWVIAVGKENSPVNVAQ